MGKQSHYTMRCLYSFSFTVQLVSKSFDIIQSICNDNAFLPQSALDSRVLCCTRFFLGSSFSVYISAKAQRLIIDVTHSQATDTRICRFFNLRFEEFN